MPSASLAGFFSVRPAGSPVFDGIYQANAIRSQSDDAAKAT
jgi:hypothetical protein